MRHKKAIFLLIFMFAGSLSASAQQLLKRDTLSFKISFRQGSAEIDTLFNDNALSLYRFSKNLLEITKDSAGILQSLNIVAHASLEGNTTFNQTLSVNRGKSVASLMKKMTAIPDSCLNVVAGGEDWNGLRVLVQNSDMPYKDEVLHVLTNTPVWVVKNGIVVDGRKRKLQMLHGGKPWRYMLEYIFPKLRASNGVVSYVIGRVKQVNDDSDEDVTDCITVSVPVDVVHADTLLHNNTYNIYNINKRTARNKFLMGIKTNLLYNVLLVPNVALEFYVGNRWSVGGAWMYSWWSNDIPNRYWRIYGGELNVRKYIGRHYKDTPLSGHHLGLYAQALTYDIEMGGRGYIGGVPGGFLWDKAHLGIGIEYGYSLPVARRINIDFSIGFGYLGGIVYEYIPINGHYVWDRTINKKWFGPTKAEVSFVWLLGNGYHNKKEGGRK